ncbi:hypothetical protein HDZ31DRAFT_9349, partial [Schizophyllum fasciatum]
RREQPPAPRGTSSLSSTLNIYSRDMLPNSHSDTGVAPPPDTQWVGYDKETINVMMAIDLYHCFVLLKSAPRLRKLTLWRVYADDNSRNWHRIKVYQLQSLEIRDSETQLRNLLDCLVLKEFLYLNVHYGSGCGPKFTADKAAYLALFQSLIRRSARLGAVGSVIIRPNHPAYNRRHSNLRGQLQALDLGARGWSFVVTDS